jgi:ABC-type branched-subunit amino acid transport system substrate-binding protein
MSLAIQLHVLVDMLAGLHYAHELAGNDGVPLRLVHRDVTPSNIFITYGGGVKLLDFGIAKVASALDPGHTKAGILKGKPRYIAPEQIRGNGSDRRTDIYAVGVMMWEMLAGRNIWHKRTDAEIVRSVAEGEAAPLPMQTPEPLRLICRRAMAHRPDDRYETAEALSFDIRAYLAQQSQPNHERGLGETLIELYGDDRARIRQIVEADGRWTLASSPPALGTRSSNMSEVGHTGPEISITPAIEELRDANVGDVRSKMARRMVLIVGVLGAVATVAMLAAGRQDAAATVAPRAAAPVPPVAPTATGVGGEPSTAPHGRTADIAAAGVRGVTADAITLGMSGAFSGASRELGNRMKLGIETSFAAVNEAGGVSGRQLKLMALDDGYDGKRALANVAELIDDRNVFAILGNVGTPTSKEALPFVLSRKTLFFGAFTGSGTLRRDPPDRYVFNYRASYEEETAKMVNYLLDVKKIPDRDIVVFAQNDSYGDAGFDGASKTLRKKGRSDEILRVGYERNSLEVDDAVNKVAEYHNATVRPSNSDVYRPKHPVKAIIMVGTYKASAKFIQKVRDKKIDTLFLNVSFVGSDALAEELEELRPGCGAGVIVTQVVPHFDSGATGVIRYREALRKYHPDQQPDFISLEGYVVGQLFAEGIRRLGRDVDTEKLIDSLEQMREFDPGVGGNLSFGMSQHQASHKVWGTVLDAQGAFRALDME